jgi:hypothetical protein
MNPIETGLSVEVSLVAIKETPWQL